jgi:hypothetical protein
MPIETRAMARALQHDKLTSIAEIEEELKVGTSTAEILAAWLLRPDLPSRLFFEVDYIPQSDKTVFWNWLEENKGKILISGDPSVRIMDDGQVVKCGPPRNLSDPVKTKGSAEESKTDQRVCHSDQPSWRGGLPHGTTSGGALSSQDQEEGRSELRTPSPSRRQPILSPSYRLTTIQSDDLQSDQEESENPNNPSFRVSQQWDDDLAQQRTPVKSDLYKAMGPSVHDLKSVSPSRRPQTTVLNSVSKPLPTQETEGGCRPYQPQIEAYSDKRGEGVSKALGAVGNVRPMSGNPHMPDGTREGFLLPKMERLPPPETQQRREYVRQDPSITDPRVLSLTQQVENLQTQPLSLIDSTYEGRIAGIEQRQNAVLDRLKELTEALNKGGEHQTVYNPQVPSDGGYTDYSTDQGRRDRGRPRNRADQPARGSNAPRDHGHRLKGRPAETEDSDSESDYYLPRGGQCQQNRQPYPHSQDSEAVCDTRRAGNSDRPRLRHNRQPPRGLPPLESYSGSEPWRDFLGQFERHRELRGWARDEAAIYLGMHLKGEALHFFQQLPKRTRCDYSAAKRSLGKRFGSLFSEETQRARFNNAVQRDSESPRQFADRLKGLAMDAYPGLPERFIESELVNRFFLGALARDAALFCANQNWGTLDGACEALQRFVEKQRSFGSQRRVRMLGPYSDWGQTGDSSELAPTVHEEQGPAQQSSALQSQIETLVKSVQELTTQLAKSLLYQQSRTDESRGQLTDSQWRGAPPGSPLMGRPRSPSPNAACWNCGERGHISRECRSRVQGPIPCATSTSGI